MALRAFKRNPRLRWLLIPFFPLLLLGITGERETAMALHKSGASGKFFCLNCHNMHATRMWGGSGGSRLLRYTKGAEFCLQCHDEATNSPTHVETGETPPYVSKIGAPNGKPTTVGAGGYFYGLAALPAGTGSPFISANAHNLDVNNPTPPASIISITGMFWCTNCHDPHGTGSADLLDVVGTKPRGVSGTYDVDAFRNLKTTDGGALPIDGLENSYTDTRYIGGTVDFCKQCHTEAARGPGAGYHPINASITALPDTKYREGMDDLLPDTNQPLIKPEDPAGNDNPTDASAANRDPGGDDQPVCLTCHYAHGGPFSNNLRWRHDGTAMSWTDPNGDTAGANPAGDTAAGCQMCHNK